MPLAVSVTELDNADTHVRLSLCSTYPARCTSQPPSHPPHRAELFSHALELKKLHAISMLSVHIFGYKQHFYRFERFIYPVRVSKPIHSVSHVIFYTLPIHAAYPPSPHKHL